MLLIPKVSILSEQIKIMTGNHLLLILTTWWTAEGASKDDESNDGVEHGGIQTPDRQNKHTSPKNTM